jgi:hypothetical protein
MLVVLHVFPIGQVETSGRINLADPVPIAAPDPNMAIRENFSRTIETLILAVISLDPTKFSRLVNWGQKKLFIAHHCFLL